MCFCDVEEGEGESKESQKRVEFRLDLLGACAEYWAEGNELKFSRFDELREM